MRRAVEIWSTSDGFGAAGQWQQVLSATHLPWSVALPPRDGGGSAFEASVRRWWIGDLALVDCSCGPCSGTRNRRELAGTDGEFVVVLINLAGRETVAQGGTEVGLRAGDAVVWDSAKPARFAVPGPLSKRSLLIPREALDELGSRAQVSGGVMLDGSRPATRLLTSYLDTLAAALPDLDPVAVSAARNATLELFGGALRAGSDVHRSSGAQPALRAAMDRYIERHLIATVTPAAVAEAHGVSVRTVNRIFNATGETVAEVIRVRRLARAREELIESDRSVASIAHRWGFSDSSHFSRLFKVHYGRSPTDYRAQARSCAGGGAFVHEPVAAVHGSGGHRRETGATAGPELIRSFIRTDRDDPGECE